MEIGRIWQLVFNLSTFELACLGALLVSAFVAGLLAIYMYSGLLLENFKDWRLRCVKRKAWIEGHSRQHGTPGGT
jgi:hypothetical protein